MEALLTLKDAIKYYQGVAGVYSDSAIAAIRLMIIDLFDLTHESFYELLNR